MLEIYNEQIIDLLIDNGADKEYKVRTKEIGSAKGKKKKKIEVYVENLSKNQVSDAAEVYRQMEIGNKNRTTAATKMNSESSRSHLLTIVSVVATNKQNKETLRGKLNLIDLAGSERVKKSGVQGNKKGMKEAMSINKSLSALGDVIGALCRKTKHIPYRNSKLTFILQDSLGQSAKTLMFINMSPANLHCQETLTSLR